jgi:hypothetical protein
MESVRTEFGAGRTNSDPLRSSYYADDYPLVPKLNELSGDKLFTPLVPAHAECQSILALMRNFFRTVGRPTDN